MPRSNTNYRAPPWACTGCCVALVACFPAVIAASICGVEVATIVVVGSIAAFTAGLNRIAPLPRNCTAIGLIVESIAEWFRAKATDSSVS